jgi:glucan endo-1,3-alpha-glucosidase
MLKMASRPAVNFLQFLMLFGSRNMDRGVLSGHAMGNGFRVCCCFGTLAFSVFAAGSTQAATTHYVFAHYMVCFATYGETVDAYKKEIQEAQAAGIDGFALNVGAWDDVQVYYKNRVAMMYNAAEQLGTGFKLFFSVDFAGESNVVNMVESYANRTNTFRYNGKIVLSSYGQNDVPSSGWPGMNWTNAIIGKLKSDGYSIFFIPYFFSDPVHELPGYADAASVAAKYSSLVDGLFWWGAAGLPDQLALCNSNYIAAVHAAGKPVMASVAPAYWGDKQPTLGRRYYELDGGEGLALQWLSIITNQPDWVEICTWNDFNENTYVSPVEDAGVYFAELQTPHRYSHKGYLELSKSFVTWFKTGKQPGIGSDALFYFYRAHPKDLVASNTNDVPVGWRTGDVEDTLYTTALLAAPAQLVITSGGKLTTNSLPAGTSRCRTPFSPGLQTFSLYRSGTQILFAHGPDILSQITNYDFFTASGFAYQTNGVNAPRNLKIIAH